MSRYPALVAAIQAKRSVKREILVRLDFTSGSMFVWTGVGPFRDLNGQIWQGVGQLGSVSDIDRALVSAQTPTLTLSGVDPVIAARALNASDEVKGQPLRIFEQYFDLETSAPVDVPLSLWSGLMDRAKISSTATQSVITVSTVTLLYRRRRPAVAYLSDATQQLLYPGDTGCNIVPQLVQRNRNWPAFS